MAADQLPNTIKDSAGSETFVSIQVIRGLSALMVAFAHCYLVIHALAQRDPPGLPHFLGGGFGVDLFFVISGFVMVYSTESLFGRTGAPWRFFARRIARIVPLYVAVTIAAVILTTPSSLLHIASSLAFWPWPPTGIPILGVGWTLNVEMMFYAAFAVALFSGSRTITIVATSIFLLLTIALPQSHPNGSVVGNPIVLELIYGMGIAVLYHAGVKIPAWAGAAIIACAVTAYLTFTPGIVLWSINLPTDYRFPAPREVTWGFPAAAIISACTLAKFRRHGSRSRIVATLQFLGDISYAVYLVHNLVFALIASLIRLLGVDVTAFSIPVAVTMMVATVATSAVIHIGFERPTTKWLQCRLLGTGKSPRDVRGMTT